ncbi:MAG: hypothetical protein ABSA12_15200 [Verrucomicrobiia bacterium]|jgi:hypothetical protein
MNCNFRSFRRVVVIALVGIGVMARHTAFADTNLVNQKFWVINGTDDLATNASSIVVTVNGHAMGAFTELAFSYNIDGTNVAPVGVIKGSGEIQMAVPYGPFGGSFFLTGYWDCDAGYVPTMSISNLDIRLKGGRTPVVEMKGQISNPVSMSAKDFELIVFAPNPRKPQLMEAEVSYTLTATTNFCVDEIIHTNQDNFEVVRMAANYLSPETNENDVARFVRVTSHICVLEYCETTRKSFCYALANEDSLVITNKPPSLGQNTIWLMNNGSANSSAPTLAVEFMKPSTGQLRPQGLISASTDPTAENVSFWGNFRDVKETYRARKKVTKVRCLLKVSTPVALSCDYNY